MPIIAPLTSSQIQFIADNYIILSSRDLALHCNVSKSYMLTYLKRNKLTRTKKQVRDLRVKAMTGKTTFTETETQFIKDNYLLLPVKRMATILNRSGRGVNGRLKQLNLIIPQELKDQRKKSTQYIKGRAPENKGKKMTEWMSPEGIERSKKTRFKKGDPAHNSKYDGHTRQHKCGYVLLRVSAGNYKLMHLYLWEQINGPVPDNHCLSCKDGNKQNVTPDNWELITRSKNLLKNVHKYPDQLIETIELTNNIKSIIDGK